MTSRKELYEKYYNSDIFNSKPTETVANATVRTREPQSPLARTKNDLFNTEKKPIKPEMTKQGIKRQGVYTKLYGSDIFCREQPKEEKKREGVRKLRNANNYSSCMESMKDNEGFKKNIKNYAAEHRAPKKEYNPDKYLKYETAAERYYKEIYDPHGSTVLPEKCLSTEHRDKKQYAEKKKNLNKETAKLNDCGVDGKKKPGEHEGFNTEKKIFVKKKGEWNDNSNECHYVDSKTKNNSKINKQLSLQSNIFKDNDKNLQNGNQNLNVEQINARIEEEKAKNEKDQKYHLGNENEKRDLTNNDRSLWGSVHTKWEKSNLDWKSPETELMFGNTASQDVEKNFGPEGPNAFQRKLNQLADTKNKDTISEENKIPINNLQKPVSEKVINGEGMEKMKEILEEIPNLKEDQKLKIKMGATTSLLNSDDLWDKKAKTLNSFYTSQNLNNKNKNKKEVAIKIGKKNNESTTKSGHGYSDYVLSYPTKKGQFEKYSESDIKKLFGSKGIHIYDVKKNVFDKGSYNTFNFKVRGNEDEGDLKKKINEVQKEFEKNDYNIEINKEKKNVKKNTKNIISNPGYKIGMINDNAVSDNNPRFTKLPDKIRNKKNFSNLFAGINRDYKSNKPKNEA
jgi:hypothetical protein